ncbi:ABC transporter permease [Anaerorhabdus furcosa]|uniref:NitT/TauT family transport system permease protein n=1 Tax=Anaerorhabdus furcosa TaxID=118967 RepID=A0A1T4PIB4_9FIRM|nr:ABC transporter permease subunit [Anaerorhabdus furcosa]SJZ91222.1 NitT/TauT family transport system permease protein [Anaerorhabdus furcosa]
MKKEHGITILILVALWQVLSMVVHNDILIPYPLDVLQNVCLLFTKSIFYQSIFSTLGRVVVGFGISFISAICLSIVSSYSKVFRNLFAPLQLLTKSIPNISYIIIALVWFGSEKSVSIICFLILFPIFYNNFLFSMDNEPQELKDVQSIYPESFFELVKKKTLPMLIPTILSSSKMAFGLGFKVAVMAEILGQVRNGIGKQLHIARLNLDTTSLFAWTIIIICICFIIDWIFDQFINRKSNGG